MTRQGITRHRRKESQDPGVDGRGRQLQEDDSQLSGGCPVPAVALGSGRSRPSAESPASPSIRVQSWSSRRPGEGDEAVAAGLEGVAMCGDLPWARGRAAPHGS